MANRMGIGSAVEWYGPDQVLQGYDLHAAGRENVYYSVWQGAVIKFTYTDGDEAAGRELLAQNLAVWNHNGAASLYTLRFHPQLDKFGDITNATPYNASGNFKMKDSAFVGATASVAPAMSEALEKIALLLAQQNERLMALESVQVESDFDADQEQEEEEPEPDAVGKIISGIGNIENAIQQSPLLNNLYQDGRALLHIFLRKMGGSPYVAEPAINGTMDNQQQQQQQPEQKFSESFGELIQQFPQLPGMILKLHHIMKTDPVTFEFAKKKLIEGVNNLG